MIPSASPRWLANHIEIARLHVTGVEPIPITPSTAQNANHPATVPGTNQKLANTAANRNSDISATGRTPRRSASPPTNGAVSDAIIPNIVTPELIVLKSQPYSA